MEFWILFQKIEHLGCGRCKLPEIMMVFNGAEAEDVPSHENCHGWMDGLMFNNLLPSQSIAKFRNGVGRSGQHVTDSYAN